MLCIPYTKRPIPGSELIQVWLFLERNGTQAISIESVDAALQMAAENGIPLSEAPNVVGDLVLMPVDATSEELKLFYTWSEVRPGDVPMREVWRPFLWCTDAAWGITPGLQTIDLGSGQSAYSILAHVLEA